MSAPDMESIGERAMQQAADIRREFATATRAEIAEALGYVAEGLAGGGRGDAALLCRRDVLMAMLRDAP